MHKRSNMVAQVLNTEAKSKRIKIQIPYRAVDWRIAIKKIQGIWYHKEQKLWSLPNNSENLKTLKYIFGDQFQVIESKDKVHLLPFEMTEQIAKQMEATMTKLILGGLSKNTIKAYRGELLFFFKHFEHQDMDTITKTAIEAYVYQLKVKNNISNAKQNLIINAIKYYLEKVLGKPRTMYEITRPKRDKTLPDTLSEDDTMKILDVLTNLKHKAILHLLYSSGLRRGEVPRLRIEDIKSSEMVVFIKGAKGRKDRTTMLSEATLKLLREYYTMYKPSYWLFEGATGGQYSESSVNKIFRKAAKAARIAQWATPHTLRHSFATHLLQANVNLRYIQSCLGHERPETTQIYTHVISVNNNSVRSPLDRILDKRKEKSIRT